MERSGLPGTVSCSVGRRTEYTPSLVALTGEGRRGTLDLYTPQKGGEQDAHQDYWSQHVKGGGEGG